LNALNGFPIREGAEVISQLACGPDIPIGVRRKAIAVLASVSDRQLLTSLLSRIDTEPAELLGDWLPLALQRSLPVPILWLQDLIRRTRDRLQRDKYLRVYCRVLVLENAAVQQQHAKFLGHLIRLAAKQQHEASDLSLALTGAFNSVADHRGALLSQMTLNFALKLLAWSIEGRADVNADQTLLAIAIVRHFRETNAGPVLRQLLDGLRENLKAFADDKRARAAADCLAELAPVELLKSPINCPVVTSILRTRSLKHGWVVYSDRILSAEGACIATLAKTDYVAVTELDEPLELQTLLAELSPQTKRVLECFWLMTSINGPCQPRDSYQSIYDATVSCYESSDQSRINQILNERFPEGFPKFGAWVRQLNHIEKKFRWQADAKALLCSLGLFRRG
jgi:hypothetical protein